MKVLLVADGTARSDVKRASVHREAQRRFKREAGKQAMSDLTHARSRLTNADYNGADERAALEGEVKALDQCVLKSSRSGVATPPDFYDQLESALPREPMLTWTSQPTQTCSGSRTLDATEATWEKAVCSCSFAVGEGLESCGLERYLILTT